MKEEFNEKFYAEENENAYNNGYNSKVLEMGGNSSDEVLQLKVSFKLNNRILIKKC